MKLEVITPEEYVGPVIGDLNRRRGLPKGQETRMGGAVAISADAAVGRNVRLRHATSDAHVGPRELFDGIQPFPSCAECDCGGGDCEGEGREGVILTK